jgi:two-component system, sensor histidine kinase ChiS
MPTRQFIYLLIFLTILSCKPKQDEVSTVGLGLPAIERAISFPQKVFGAPDTLDIRNVNRVWGRRPQSIPSTNLTKGTLRENRVVAGAPIIVVPGQDTIPQALVVHVEDSLMLAGIPEPTPAKDPYFPSHNSQSFSYYTRLQGLHHDDISAVAQDRFGNFWIGTYGAGITRFDGLNFYNYSDQEGLSQNYVLSILICSQGNVWLGTRGEGAIMFDGKYFHYFNTSNGLINNRVEAIFEDSKGNIWFGTYEGVSMYDGEKMTSYTADHGLGAPIVYVILEDRDANMWFGTRGGGIAKFDGNAFYRYTREQGMICDFIVTGAIDSQDNLWFGSYERGGCRFDGEAFYRFSTAEGLMNNQIRAISEDKFGNIWIGHASEGITRLSGDSFSFFTEEHGLHNAFVTSFFHDASGSVWFGTYGGGMGRYMGNLFSHHYETHGLRNSFVRSFLQDREGYVWMGTNSAGVMRFDGQTFLNYATDQGLSFNRVGGMLQDRQGTYWFATGGGISLFDGQYFSHITEDNGLIENFILSLMKDSKGNIWMVTRDHGVIKYDGAHYIRYGVEQGLSDVNARVMAEDSYGNIWIGTRAGGVNKFDGQYFTHYTTNSGLLTDNILDLMADSQGNIWIGTNGQGATRFDGEFFTHYTEKEGLVNNFVYSLLEDHNGDIWMGTRMGLSKLLKNRSYISQGSLLDQDRMPEVLFRNYTQLNGYLGIGTNSRAMFQDDQNRIWIGANDVLTVYHPDQDVKDTLPPKVNLHYVGLFNQRVNWSQARENNDQPITLANGVEIANYSFDSISSWFGIPQNLSLAFDNNHITFGFAGIGACLGDAIKYQFMLDGLEYGWNNLTDRNEVSYGRLAPGQYAFMVRAVNRDGLWSDPVSYSFHIRPPLYKTPAAYAVFVFVGLLVLIILYTVQRRFFIRREKEKQKELVLQNEIAIARKSADFKQNFLANMSHELRTPLTGVLGMANLLSQLPLDEKAREYVEDLNKSGESLRETINMILDISKMEAGKLKLRRNNFSIHEVFNDCMKLFAPLCEDEVAMHGHVDDDMPEFLYSDEQRIKQIVKNLLSNAVKFTKKGKIELKASIHQSGSYLDKESFYIRISVNDTGPGIDYHEQHKLFTPFYQTELNSSRASEGTGLGLAICKELSLLLGGQIGLESSPGVGSSFWFTFRAKKGNPSGLLAMGLLKSDPSPDGTKKSFNILLVEDKQLIQKVVSLMLNAMGHSVVIAINGEDALSKFSPGIFDLILMDIQMPVMDGITATQKLRKMHENLPPIIGLSANAFEGDRQKYMALGLDEYLTKPFKENDFEELLSRLGLG